MQNNKKRGTPSLRIVYKKNTKKNRNSKIDKEDKSIADVHEFLKKMEELNKQSEILRQELYNECLKDPKRFGGSGNDQ
jgi:hypothetical protein